MRHLLKKLLPSVAVALTVTGSSLPIPARAQTYPIDCAILLCLSGGWPASVPCARARAEFIRRITPWPVEPPLQIWRCPMGASYENDRLQNNAGGIFEALYRTDSRRPLQSLPVDNLVPTDLALRLVPDCGATSQLSAGRHRRWMTVTFFDGAGLRPSDQVSMSLLNVAGRELSFAVAISFSGCCLSRSSSMSLSDVAAA